MISRAWSLWQANTISSVKTDSPESSSMRIEPSACSSRYTFFTAWCWIRTCAFCRAFCARKRYSLEPPLTVSHWGRLVIWSRPWFSQNCVRVWIGKDSISFIEQDQIAPIIGNKYQSLKALLRWWRVKNSCTDSLCIRAVCCSLGVSAIFFASALNRKISIVILRKWGLKRFFLWANRLFRSCPAHSRFGLFVCGIETEKDISDRAIGTSNSWKNWMSFG